MADPMTAPRPNLDALERLLEEAHIPGPYSIEPDNDHGNYAIDYKDGREQLCTFLLRSEAEYLVALLNAAPALIAAARERDAERQQREQAEQREARLIGMLKEYEEADVNDGIMQEQLKAANERADALYRQYEANRDDEELQARRRENLDDCLRLADVASQARRRKQAARQAIKAALSDAALAEGQDG